MAPDTSTINFTTAGFVTYYTRDNTRTATETVWIEESYENALYNQQKLAQAARIEAWLADRWRAALRAERERQDPEARPPKARTEWGMVHRERCVHRMGVA